MTLRNIGIIAHVDAGKTTLTERILYFTGATHSLGEVHQGNTVTDSSVQEKAKGITINSAAVSITWRKSQINIIDTPGHIDFNMEVKRALRVLDGAVVVFDAVSGVEPQSETNWRLADKYRVPRICLINKMDRVGANYFAAIASIKEKLNAVPLVLQVPIATEDRFNEIIDIVGMQLLSWDGDGYHQGPIPDDYQVIADRYREQMIETLADYDETVFEHSIEGIELTRAVIIKAIREATLRLDLVPVLCGSAYKNRGIEPVLDGVIHYLPSPEDRPVVTGTDIETGDVVALDKEAFTALAFKIATDQHDSLTYLRVYSGSMESGGRVMNCSSGKKERFSRISLMQAAREVPLSKIKAGDIVAVRGLKHTKTGDTLSDGQTSLVLESIDPPRPVIDLAMEAKSTQDRNKLGLVLKRLVNEDPSLSLNANDDGQLIVSGMGELHLEVLVDRLATDFDLEVATGKPRVAYRERLGESTSVRYLHKKQDGGSGQYAELEVLFEPLSDPEAMEFEAKIVGGSVPKEYFSAVFEGIKNQAAQGVLGNYPCAGFRCTLMDGSIHENDSSPLAFKIAAMEAFKLAAKQAEVKLIEPLMSLEVVSPSSYVGEIVGDINRRRGSVVGQDYEGDLVTIDALVPLASMFGYINDLRSKTSGRATFTMAFKAYGDVPEHIARNVLNAY